MKREFIVLVLLSVFVLFGCEKGPLDGRYDAYEGKWKWVYTQSRTRTFDNYDASIRPASEGYNAYVEFTKGGELVFFIDGDVIATTKYKVTDQNSWGSNQSDYSEYSLEVDFDVDENGLRLFETRTFGLLNDSLYFEGFPFDGYKETDRLTGLGYFHRLE
jgi:hypothetical protein